MRRIVRPVMERIMMARERLHPVSTLLQLISVIPARSRSFKNHICSGELKRVVLVCPVEGMPWKSAMPRWEVELPDEFIWKIIMGEYDGAGINLPRTWEEEE